MNVLHRSLGESILRNFIAEVVRHGTLFTSMPQQQQPEILSYKIVAFDPTTREEIETVYESTSHLKATARFEFLRKQPNAKRGEVDYIFYTDDTPTLIASKGHVMRP